MFWDTGHTRNMTCQIIMGVHQIGKVDWLDGNGRLVRLEWKSVKTGMGGWSDWNGCLERLEWEAGQARMEVW